MREFETRLYELYSAVEDALPSLTGILGGAPAVYDGDSESVSSHRAAKLQAVKRALWAAAKAKPCETNDLACNGRCWPCSMRRY